MKICVFVTQQRQLTCLIVNSELEDKLMYLASTNDSGASMDYNVAYCRVAFSLWLFERGNVVGAIEQIQSAVIAYPSWAYPEYLYGWFGLFLDDVDVITHFKNAIYIDWSFLQKISSDKVCRQFPDILKEIRKLVLVS